MLEVQTTEPGPSTMAKGLSAKKFTKLEVSPRRRSHDVASAYITRPQSKSHRRGTMHAVQASKNSFNSISFGYAASIQAVRVETHASVSVSDEEGSSYNDDQPSTSVTESDQTYREGEFFARMPNKVIVPLSCECLSGREADVFLEALGDKNRDKIQKYLEKEEPDIGEYHIWIRNDDTSQVTVVSIKALENHFRSERVKRVKWRHMSLDKASIYRYSVPVITTKFRLRIVHFLSRNYRCCILCVWCFVIFFISIGIVLTVIVGSTPIARPYNESVPYSTTHRPHLNENRLLNAAKNGGMPAHG
ncbi:unnamed protein product [Bursaphelenchus okinawaensis]|uniref:Uncharacterized protein n=1 Tax=Bursaphelenchus okinawaensis TaxID=465554 RepID=A0A811KUG9_9BILA|nr:unnamed protein product [Bursaphelenchus okinawaensis]CAG9112330.1 unnamed protein product [Bursaphelenchus okinawaensis]